MKNRWLLGLLVSLTACSNDEGSPPSTGGSGGQPSATGGMSSMPKAGSSGNATTGGTSSGGSKATSGGTTSGGAAGNGAGGTSAGSSATGGSAGDTSKGGSSGGAAAGGTGGATPPVGGSGGLPPAAGGDVLERNGGPTREGHFVQPTLTKAAAAKMTFDSGFKATFKGNMYASPLYVADGPGGKAAFFAVSTDNIVAAFDASTGAELWSKALGTAPGAAGQGCFKGDPVGILSTPVIDAESRTIYVAAATGTGMVERHEVHALSIDDGASKAGWPVSPTGQKSGSYTFNTRYQNQRSALSLANGTLYVAYGGFVGDCNDYRGVIFAVDTSDPTSVGSWMTRGTGEAIWAPGGFASDGTSIFPVTGNANRVNNMFPSSRDQSDSEAVLRISGLAAFTREDKNHFWPTSWKSMDSADADFGATNTMLIRVPGSTPETLLVAIAKDGYFYLLDPTNLGGEGGQVVDFRVATGAMAIKTVPTSYKTEKGTYVAFSTDAGAECPSNVGGKVIMSVLVSPGAPPTADTAWCSPLPTGSGNPTTAPISTTTDGKSNAIVWFMYGSELRGVDGDTGATVFDGEADCTGVMRWTSPIAAEGRIVAGANGKLCSWKAQ